MPPRKGSSQITGTKAHDRYSRGVEYLKSIAKDDDERAVLEALKIPAFLVERDETDTALSFFQLSATSEDVMPCWISKRFEFKMNLNKKIGRTKRLVFVFGRPPEQSHLADCLRAMNFVFKLLDSITSAEVATIDSEAISNIFQEAGDSDERLRLYTLSDFGGLNRWRALRARHRTPELKPESIRREGEEILAKQQETGSQYDDSDLVSTLSQSLCQLEKRFEVSIVETDQATRRFYFETGAEEDKKLMDMKKKDYMNRFLGGRQRYVHLERDLNSPYLQSSFNRDIDVVFLQDGRTMGELLGTSKDTLYKLRVILPFVNVPTFMVHRYLENMISTGTAWDSNVDAEVIIGFLPNNCTIHRMMYGENNTLVLNRTYRVNEIPAACKTQPVRGSDGKGFIYRYYLQLLKKKLRSSSQSS